jgi:siroheme synthase-like protein
MTEVPAGTPSSPSPYYPVSLDLSDKPCLVVGAGPVAARKVRGLLDCDARVTVIAPDIGEEMRTLTPRLAATEPRAFRPGDVAGFRLVVTATGDPAVDGAVAAEADAAGVWVNSADDPEHCSFILPAVHRDGAVTIAVSTGGLSPALAAWLRNRLAASSGSGLDALARLLDETRQRLRSEGRASDTVDWAGLLDGELPSLVRAGDLVNARAILQRATSR